MVIENKYGIDQVGREFLQHGFSQKFFYYNFHDMKTTVHISCVVVTSCIVMILITCLPLSWLSLDHIHFYFRV